MISILHTEFFRLKKNKLFWILLGVTALFPLLSALFSLAMNYLALDVMLPDGYEIENVWELLRSSDMFGSGLSNVPSLAGDTFLAMICTSIFLSQEFSNGTFRNMLLANKSRLELYLSYLAMSVIIGAAFLGVTFVSTFVFFSAIFGFGGLSALTVISACFLTLAMGFVSTLFVQSMVCMFIFGTRKMAVAIVCPLVITMIAPSILTTIVGTLSTLNILSSTDLTWVPLHNTTLLSVTDVDAALVGKILMYNIPLSVFFGFMGWVGFRKADLK